MNKDIFKGQWSEVKGKFKEQWGKLTDDDLTQINGKRDQLLGTLQKRYGYAKDQAENEVKKFESGDFEHHNFEANEGEFEEIENFNKGKTGKVGDSRRKSGNFEDLDVSEDSQDFDKRKTGTEDY